MKSLFSPIVSLSIVFLAGCQSPARLEQANLPTSLLEITLQRPAADVPILVVDEPQKFSFDPRANLVSSGEMVQIPAGVYRPVGQTSYGTFYLGPAPVTFSRSQAGLGGIVLVPGSSPRVWAADFQAVPDPAEAMRWFAVAFAMPGTGMGVALANSAEARNVRAVSMLYINCGNLLRYRLDQREKTP